MWQETTMAKAGTLPEFCYLPVQDQCQAPVDINNELEQLKVIQKVENMNLLTTKFRTVSHTAQKLHQQSRQTLITFSWSAEFQDLEEQ